MKRLGANVVRIHLQFGKFMKGPNEPNESALKQYARLVALAEQTNLYLDVTGLGCYHKKDVPKWYDRLSEEARWAAQANFWKYVANRSAQSPAIFCYDLMNEPVVPGGDRKPEDWLGPDFAGSCFVQCITLSQAGRPRPSHCSPMDSAAIGGNSHAGSPPPDYGRPGRLESGPPRPYLRVRSQKDH